jgi:hypothetical protein
LLPSSGSKRKQSKKPAEEGKLSFGRWVTKFRMNLMPTYSGKKSESEDDSFHLTVVTNQTTWHHILEDSSLHIYRQANLKSHRRAVIAVKV